MCQFLIIANLFTLNGEYIKGKSNNDNVSSLIVYSQRAPCVKPTFAGKSKSNNSITSIENIIVYDIDIERVHLKTFELT